MFLILTIGSFLCFKSKIIRINLSVAQVYNTNRIEIFYPNSRITLNAKMQLGVCRLFLPKTIVLIVNL